MEASGRPSGTGRPSLLPPRADHERADEARETPQPEPFEKVLDDAEAPAVAPDPSNAPAGPAAPAAPKSKKAAPPEAGPPVLPSVDPDPRLLPISAGAPPVPTEVPHAERARPDALALPVSAPIAAKVPVPPQGELASAPEQPVETLPASPAEIVKLAGTESPEAPQALAPEARADAVRTLETRPAAAPPPPPPAENARASEILRQMRVQLTPELRSATIQLSPPELGRISIRLRVERGELSAVVRAEKRETLVALQRHVPELEATLGQLGIRAREIDLQLGFEQQGARQGPDDPADSHGRSGHEHDPRAREHERRLYASLSARAGGIDTYA